MKQQNLFDSTRQQLVPLKEKNGVEHVELSCRTILNYCDTRRMPDLFTINPYRGCEFGCAYCYARYTHGFMELPWSEFEKKIFVKSRAAEVLLKTLDQRKVAGRHIALGTATDPYQPAEARFRVTRELLQVFTLTRDLSLSITTKSSLVKRDIPLFQDIAKKNDFRVNISLMSLDEKLLAGMEPKASRPEARLNALQELDAAGIRTGIFLMPILPGITDSRQNLESVIRAAHLYGAHYVAANILFLRESAREIFYRFLRENYPRLYREYRQTYGDRSWVPKAYETKIHSMVRSLKRKYGFTTEPRAAKAAEISQNHLWGRRMS